LHYGDLSDGTGLRRVLETVDPDEVYNLGAQSHVKVSFDIPEYTAEVVAIGTLRLIEAVRDHVLHGGRAVRYYQAGSSCRAAPRPSAMCQLPTSGEPLLTTTVPAVGLA
jgi:GDPmannose 4,6-dehydratase